MTARRILAASALALFASPAAAADILPFGSPYSFAGLYLGIEGGYGQASSGNASFDATGTFITGRDAFLGSDYDGFVGGVYAGYNAQLGSLVLGAEGALSFSNIEGGASEIAGTQTETFNVRTDYAADLRGRVGYSFGRVMPYIAGGVSFAGFDASYSLNDPAVGSTRSDAAETLQGYNLGAGVEIGGPGSLHLRGDYRIRTFDDRLDLSTAQTLSTEIQTTQEVKFGVGIRF